MASVDELLADPAGCLELGDGAVPLHAFVIVEYVVPGGDDYPGRRRLAVMSDDEMPLWLPLGVLKQAELLALPSCTGDCERE